MKYIKLFEQYIKEILNDKQVIYDFNIGDNTFKVFFKRKNDNCWFRYYIANNDNAFTQLKYSNAFEIAKIVTDITEDFIKEFNPNLIEITHIDKKGEYTPGKLNSRAKLNYRYMKNIKGYRLSYFSDSEHGDILAILCKNNYDDSNYYYNNKKRYTEITP